MLSVIFLVFPKTYSNTTCYSTNSCCSWWCANNLNAMVNKAAVSTNLGLRKIRHNANYV